MVVPWLSDITKHTGIKAPPPSRNTWPPFACDWKKHKIALFVVIKVNEHVNFRLKKRLIAIVCCWKSAWPPFFVVEKALDRLWKSTRKRSTCGLKSTRGLPVFLDVKTLSHPFLWLKKTQEDHLCLWLKKHLITFVYVFVRTLKLKRHSKTTCVCGCNSKKKFEIIPI